MTAQTWQKSSYCEAGSTCVHIAATSTGEILLHESEYPKEILATTPGSLSALMSRIKKGPLMRYRI